MFERIDKNHVMTGREQIPDNVIEHEELFTLGFGDAGTVKQTVGTRQTTDTNPPVICIHIRTGSRTEVNVGYSVLADLMAKIMYKGKYSIAVSRVPWARVGDEGNILENSGLTNDNPLVTFLSADGKDPRKGFTRKGYVKTPEGWRLGDVEVPPRPDGGYPPNTDLFWTFRWIRETGGNIPPLDITYHGTDEPEYGGEQLIANHNMVEAGVAIPFQLGDLTGVFIPD